MCATGITQELGVGTRRGARLGASSGTTSQAGAWTASLHAVALRTATPLGLLLARAAHPMEPVSCHRVATIPLGYYTPRRRPRDACHGISDRYSRKVRSV